MTSQDFFFIAAGISVLIVLATWLFIAYKIINLISKAEIEIKSLKGNLKLGGLNLISKILNLKKVVINNGKEK